MAVRKPKAPPAPIAATSGPAEAEAGGILTIDLAAIVANWQTIAQTIMPVECAAVVKANAYGCGLERVVPVLADAGCATFFVADLAEARRVRAVERDATVYVLSGLLPNTTQAFADANVRPVINSMTELAEWDAFVAANDWRGGFALHVDTGINRLGITPDDAAALASRIKSPNHGIELLMSHLACAETPEHPLNDRQIRLFRDIRLLYRGIPASLANSAGVFLGAATHCDLVRPGIALYGVNPSPGRANPMKPVVGLKGRIVQVRQIARGDSVGYGAAWTATRPSRVAVVAIGYGDGYLRAAAAGKDKPSGEVIVGEWHCPIIGRISMDLLTVDVTELPDGSARRGALVTLIGDDIGIEQVAAWSATIGYEILTHLGPRYHRVYK